MDRGVYDPRALRDWTFEVDARQDGGGGGGGEKAPRYVWIHHGDLDDDGGGGGQKVIPEAMLMETERALLDHSPKVADYLLEPQTGGPKTPPERGRDDRGDRVHRSRTPRRSRSQQP